MASDVDFEKYADDAGEVDFEAYGAPTKPYAGAGPDDVGPPSDGLSMANLDPVHASELDAVVAGANAGLPFAAQASAGIKAAADAISGKASLLDAYRKARTGQQVMGAAAQEQHPGFYLAGNLPVAATMAMASAAAIPARAAAAAGPLATRFIGNLVPTAADNTSKGTGIGGTAKDMLVGEAVGAGFNAALTPAKSIGRAVMNATSEPLAAASEWIGKSRIGKWLGAGATDTGTSAVARDLSGDVSAAASFKPKDVQLGDDLSGRLAKAKLAGESRVDLGRDGNFGFDPSSEFGDDLLRVSDEALDSSLKKNAPDFFEKGNDATREMRGSAKSIRREAAGSPEVDTKVDKNAPTRPRGQAAGPASAVRNDLEEARRLERMAHKTDYDYDTAQNKTWDDAVSSAKDKVGTTQENIANKWHLDTKAAQAEKRLGAIAAGRETIKKGAALGAMVGGGQRGMVEGAAGLVLGKDIGSKALRGIDMAGEVGQKLAKMQSWAENMAMRDDAIGKAAQWALSADGDAMIARLAALADLPEAQEAMR